MVRVGNPVLARMPDLLSEELEEPGGTIDAFEDEGKGGSFVAKVIRRNYRG